MDASEKTKLQPKSSGSRKSFTRMTPLEKSLLITLGIVSAIVITLIVIIIAQYSNESSYKAVPEREKISLAPKTCDSVSCVSEASHLLKSMDLNFDPCDDFYSYVCNNWIKNTHLLSSSIDTQFTRISRSLNFRVKDILQNKTRRTKKHEKKVKDFYEACVNLDETHQKATKTMKKDIENFGGWPLIDKNWKASMFKWSDLMVNFSRNGYIDNMLLRVTVERDFRNTSSMLLTVSQPSLGLANKIFFTLPDEDILNGYKHVIYKIAKFLSPSLEEKSAMQKIKDALNIEIRLAKLSVEIDKKHMKKHYNVVTLQEMKKFAPKIPWQELLQKLLPPDTTLEENEKVLVLVPNFIKGLNKILEEMDNHKGKESLANYIFYRALTYMAPHLSEHLYHTIFSFRKKESAGFSQISDFCADTATSFFHMSLTGTYVSEYLDEDARGKLDIMFRDIQRALIEKIKQAPWLDEETRDYALIKVKTIRTAIAYPNEIMNETVLNDYYRDLTISDDHYSNMKNIIVFNQKQRRQGLREQHPRFSWYEMHNLLTANAFYQPNQNSITIPVGILQEIVFAPGRPNYINYGSLGTIVGHEMTHAFDSTGSLYDAEGNYRMWWTNSSWSKFQEKAQCFVDQYNKYYEPRASAFVDGKLTLEENIADNGGIQITYKAYNNLLSRMKEEKKLPGLYYTEKQMFWIAYSSVWCRKQTDDKLLVRMKHSSHTPAKFRVIASLSNTKEFAEDFKCELGTKMNPKEKCSLWD